ncbi:hypothetical protein [Roseateles oligotrophus]|uniref:Acetyltransferase n=1 Tax=Roseateles oligotrophus TaxID=1769250 RepID=A0ABT2YMN0_9BURK|nr:hypothetical protein [Roseateles oligotrophus]MCV2371316.1 hypothetical protein [Roseateles oligotrophus]
MNQRDFFMPAPQSAAEPRRAPQMRRFDVCNGDADGLCAVLQWRLQQPLPATLITGLKRDIELLRQVPVLAGEIAGPLEVLVCDLSMQRNLPALQQLLAMGAQVHYFDHHGFALMPAHPGLHAHLDSRSNTCSSLLMDRYLQGRWRDWALVGAYGDNLLAVADALALASGINERDRGLLRQLGEAINYNAYGETLADVLISPTALYGKLARFQDPLQALQQEPVLQQLLSLKSDDLRKARTLTPFWQDGHASLLILPDEPWTRRVSGCLANSLVQSDPQRAHAVLRSDPQGGHRVSVRAPLDAPAGADELCRQFGGGGRVAAAGIDHLPVARLQPFIEAFAVQHWGQRARAA